MYLYDFFEAISDLINKMYRIYRIPEWQLLAIFM
jgi:hypothetical protein